MQHPKPKVLFILKRREDYNIEKHSSHVGLSTGLYNSAKFMDEMLNKNGIESKMVVVIDNNCIDREVHQYKPTHVIIEALWVVPSKFDILIKLHPKVKWIIRLHSELPFLAGEGMSFDWLGDYANYDNIVIAANAPRALQDVRYFLAAHKNWSKEYAEKRVIYLPNYFKSQFKKKKLDKTKDTIDIACFGAVRPLKNHVQQAIAAIRFAEKNHKFLRFHINSGRFEMKGEPVFRNIEGMFAHLFDNGHELHIHEWRPREEFLELCSQMDLGMQVSFTETFNIVTADLLSQGVPIVGSNEIPWLSELFCADPTETKDIIKILDRAYKFPKLNVWINNLNLKAYIKETEKIWVDYFENKCFYE